MNAYLVIVNNKYKTINVNDEELAFEFEIQEEFLNYSALYWRKNNPHPNNPDGITIYQKEGETLHLESTEENYNTYFKYYVDLWQAEKDRLEQEAENEKSFPVRQNKALEELGVAFQKAEDRAHVKSSLGYTVDADQEAKDSVDSILDSGAAEVEFCDFYNGFRTTSKTDLETLKREISSNLVYLRQQKFNYRAAIEACTNNKELDSIISTIKFEYLDFSNPT